MTQASATRRIEQRALTAGDLGGSLVGAILTHVSMAGLTAPGARLAGASVRFAEARGARLGGVDLAGALLEHVDFKGADLRSANLRGATLRDCGLEGVRLDAADLTDATLLRCALDGAQLRGSRWTDAATVQCSFEDAVIEGARDFTTCRDLVVEVLRREARNLDELATVGAVALDRRLCYPEWRGRLSADERGRALEAFAQYPESGFSAALERPTRSG